MKALDRLIQRWRMAKTAKWIWPGATLLDVGCWDGALLARVGDRIESGVGIDPLLPAARRERTYVLVKGRFPDDMPCAGPFDVITMLAVLEHLPENELGCVADACRRLLQPGGRIIITIPSPAADRILGILLRLRVIDGQELADHHGLTAADVLACFRRAGFELIEWRTFQLGLNNLIALRKR